MHRGDALHPATSTSLRSASAAGSLSAFEPCITSSRSSNSTTSLSSTYSSDPELIDALHALDMCSGEDNIAGSDGRTPPFSFDLFFPLVPLPAEQGVDISTSTTSLTSSEYSGPTVNNENSSREGTTLFDDKTGNRENMMASCGLTPPFSDLSLFFSQLTPLPHNTGLPDTTTFPTSSDLEMNSDRETVESEMGCILFDLFPLTPLPQSTELPSQGVSTPALPSSGPTVSNENSSREKTTADMEFLINLFPLIPFPLNAELQSPEVPQPMSKERRADMIRSSTPSVTSDPLPSDQATIVPGEISSPSPLSSHSSTPENDDTISVINPDPPAVQTENLCIHSALTETSIARSFSPVHPSADHLEKNVTTEDSSTQTGSQMEADSNIEAQTCNEKIEKLEKIVSIVTTDKQQRQRRLNNVSALHYRRRRKGRESDLELRMKELGATNKRLKEKVSDLTTEIHKMRRLLQQSKTREPTKVCRFFLNSTCSMLN